MISSVLPTRSRRVARLPHQGTCLKVLAECPPCCTPCRPPGSPVLWNHLCPCCQGTLKSTLAPAGEVGVCQRLAAVFDVQFSGATCFRGTFKKAWSLPVGWVGLFQGWAGMERGPAFQCYLRSGSLVDNWGRIQKQGGQQPRPP